MSHLSFEISVIGLKLVSRRWTSLHVLNLCILFITTLNITAVDVYLTWSNNITHKKSNHKY